MEIKISGADELEAYLKRKGDLKNIKMLVRHHGADLQRTMKRKADFKGHMGWSKGKGRTFIKPSGETKASIGLSIQDGGLSAVVQPTTEYSPYLEYGTRFMDAQPFIRPALDEVAPRFKSDLRKEMNRG